MAGNADAQVALGFPSTSAAAPPALLEHRQPFCGDPEGWGPISPIQYDFTPCFLDIWICSTAVFGLVMGAGAVWFLLKHRIAEPVSKNWHFYTKLVRLKDGLK